MNAQRLVSFALALLALGCGSDTGQKVGISGRVSRAVSGSAKPAEAGARVTHVMAVTASSQNVQRVLAEVDADGSFALDVDGARPWVIVFLDATRVGSDMVLGVFRAQALDTLPASAAASDVRLGNVEVVDGAAAGDVPYASLLAALGIDPDAAADLGEVDDICLRYVNPDVDGDGVIDAEQEGRQFGLDFHVQLAMQVDGRAATVADLVGAFLPAGAVPSYGGTGIYVSYPQGYAGDEGAAVRFDDDATIVRTGVAGGPAWVGAGTPLSGNALVANRYGDMRSFGVFAAPGHPLPQGRYQFSVGGRTLTFDHVRTPSDMMLAGLHGYLLPFIRLVPEDPDCRGRCPLAGVDYEWRRLVDGEWRVATAEELALFVGDQGGYLSIRRGSELTGEGLGVTIPATSPSGTLDVFEGLLSTDVCHLGLSVDDKLGMRAFAGIANAPGTCGPPM